MKRISFLSKNTPSSRTFSSSSESYEYQAMRTNTISTRASNDFRTRSYHFRKEDSNQQQDTAILRRTHLLI